MKDLEKKIKEKLLESLISQCDEWESDRVKPKHLAVEVAAPDKEHLSEGLEKAKDLLDSKDEDEHALDAHDAEDSHDEDMSDEDRLRALLAGDDEEDEDERR